MNNLTFQGRVERGEGMATKLGCPTANIAIEQGVIIPGLGVYLAVAVLDGVRYPSIACINDGRTGNHLKMEVHLMGVNKVLDGKRMRVSLLQKTRALVPFEDNESMARLIAKDLEQAREWFARNGYEIPTNA